MNYRPNPEFSVCVFCGSRPGNEEIFTQTAKDTGTMIANAGYRLVFGAGGLGLMGAVAQASLDAGGKVTGIVPEFLKKREIPVPEIDDLLIVDSMHTRKRLMYERSDVFVVLPGGLGTLDELVETVTWFQLDLHCKPVYLVNTNGYWDSWMTLVRNMVSCGFVDANAAEYFRIVENVPLLADCIKADQQG